MEFLGPKRGLGMELEYGKFHVELYSHSGIQGGFPTLLAGTAHYSHSTSRSHRRADAVPPLLRRNLMPVPGILSACCSVNEPLPVFWRFLICHLMTAPNSAEWLWIWIYLQVVTTRRPTFPNTVKTMRMDARKSVRIDCSLLSTPVASTLYSHKPEFLCSCRIFNIQRLDQDQWSYNLNFPCGTNLERIDLRWPVNEIHRTLLGFHSSCCLCKNNVPPGIPPCVPPLNGNK